jgi:DNA-binding CsgD family transcriptional regulator
MQAVAAARAAPDVPVSGITAGDLLLEGFIALAKGNHAEAVVPLRAAVAQLREGKDQQWLGLGVQAASELWDDAALRHLLSQQVQLARDEGALTKLPLALSQLGNRYHLPSGRIEAAETCFEEAREIAASTKNTGLLGPITPGDVFAAAWRGHEGDARALAEACIQDVSDRGVGILGAAIDYAIAVLENGLAHYDAAFAAARHSSGSMFVGTAALPELVEAAVRCGERAAALDAVAELEDRAVPADTDWALGMLARSRAQIADPTDADAIYREAIDRLGRCSMAAHLARAHLLYGEWLRRRRRQREARDVLNVAYSMLSSMGMEGFAERARLELYAAGERKGEGGAKSLEELTAQEMRIAGLVTGGASNPEVAATMFISRRTVEYHLSHIYTKLGVSSRTQLVRALMDASN